MLPNCHKALGSIAPLTIQAAEEHRYTCTPQEHILKIVKDITIFSWVNTVSVFLPVSSSSSRGPDTFMAAVRETMMLVQLFL